ncbi:MAG: hypothetical protein LBL34_04780, partial [Clostridiales bacterium]|nr:hypothetical protein [Clostridiales bacterium]
DSAALEKTLEGYTEDAIKTLFNAMSKYFVDKEVNAPVTAYLIADLYNAIVDMASVNMSKGSSISLDENGLLKYKGFTLVETPSQYFVEDEIAYFSPAGIVIPFVGIEIARTIESEDFAGVALQAFAKGGNFILDDNKAALAKVTTAAPSNYNVTVTPSQNGTVTSSAASAAAGATVTLTIAPDSNYQLGTITANDGAVTLSGTGNTRTFTMPAGNVTIAATFTST